MRGCEYATERQSAVLEAIKDHKQAHGWPPTCAELAAVFGCNVNAISDHLKALERKGYIKRTPHTARGITVL